jgi:hypothetical protein
MTKRRDKQIKHPSETKQPKEKNNPRKKQPKKKTTQPPEQPSRSFWASNVGQNKISRRLKPGN